MIVSAPYTSVDESNLIVMDSGVYSWVFYGINHVISQRYHLKEDAKFIMARNQSFEARFRNDGDHRRQLKYPVCFHYFYFQVIYTLL